MRRFHDNARLSCIPHTPLIVNNNNIGRMNENKSFQLCEILSRLFSPYMDSVPTHSTPHSSLSHTLIPTNAVADNRKSFTTHSTFLGWSSEHALILNHLHSATFSETRNVHTKKARAIHS